MKVNDIQMYYEIHGEGEPLVLILDIFFLMRERQQFLDAVAQNLK